MLAKMLLAELNKSNLENTKAKRFLDDAATYVIVFSNYLRKPYFGLTSIETFMWIFKHCAASIAIVAEFGRKQFNQVLTK